jgi:hypothetical protein
VSGERILLVLALCTLALLIVIAGGLWIGHAGR